MCRIKRQHNTKIIQSLLLQQLMENYILCYIIILFGKQHMDLESQPKYSCIP